MTESARTAAKAEAPGWFLKAIAEEAQILETACQGSKIMSRCWNPQETEKPGLLFVNGHLAHARWWDFIAPFFTRHYRVVAMDFSGMGDSPWRHDYSLAVHSAEIRAVVEGLDLTPATVVAHSYGGGRLLRMCSESCDGIKQAVVIDSYLQLVGAFEPTVPVQAGRVRNAYSDFAAARARFRLRPEQPAEPYLLDHVARHSLKPVESGWDWKFDPDLPLTWHEPSGAALLKSIHLPIVVIRGENSSVVSERLAAQIVAELPCAKGPIVIPTAGHHIMLDQPLALVSALRAVLE